MFFVLESYFHRKASFIPIDDDVLLQPGSSVEISGTLDGHFFWGLLNGVGAISTSFSETLCTSATVVCLLVEQVEVDI